MGILKDLFAGSGSGTGSNAASDANVDLDRALLALQEGFAPTAEGVDPFIAAGQGALPGLGQFGEAGTGALGDLAGAATPGGLDERLRQIFSTGTFGALRDERTRAVQGQLAAGGLTRSGTGLSEIARVPTDLGLQIENMLAGRSGALAGLGGQALGGLAGGGQGAALGLGNLRESSLAKQAALLAQRGQNIASGVLTDQGIQSGTQQGFLNLLGTGLGALPGILKSDPALKTNVEKISEIGDLNLYEWDWRPETAGTGIDELPTVGFMADEVQKLYPEFVFVEDGFQSVDYLNLIPALREKFTIPERAA